MSAVPEHGDKRIVFLGAERRENAMRRFAFGREVPSLRGDRGMFAYTGKNHLTLATYVPSFLSGGSMRISRTEPQRDE